VVAVCGAATILSAYALRPRRATGLRLHPGVVYAAESEELDPGDAQGCGGRSKKTLTDRGAASINFAPSGSSVAALRTLDPTSSGAGKPRVPTELDTYRVTARLVYAKRELDHDIHLVIQDPTTLGTMIVEFPDPTCPVVVGTPHAAEIAAARRAILQAIGPSDAPRLFGTAEITGVGFFDLVHGQQGVAPNGIELHPALGFRLLTQPSLALPAWRARRSGGWIAEHATVRLCALRPGRYRVIVNEHARGAATRTFTRTIVQSARCNSSTLSWRFPGSSRPRPHDLTVKVTVSGGQRLQAARTKTLS
jgi:hypothetical protein